MKPFWILFVLFASLAVSAQPASDVFKHSAPIWLQETTPSSAVSWTDLRRRILSDESNRISDEFKIPNSLKKRAAFWFDIYTLYGKNQHVIHHVRYPWIIYKVVDTTDMVANGKGPLWLREQRANRYVKRQTQEIEKALRKLAHRRSYRHMKGLERELYMTLKRVRGNRRHVFREAAANVRSQLGQRDFFRSGLVNSSKYLPYMEEEFSREKLPVELTRLPFVESSFNEAAYSKVGASGIWQIMPRTGRAYMIVSKTIDERNSPLKATRVAAKIFRRYHRALKSWPLAITAYNHGIGNLRKAIRAAHSHDLATIIARYHSRDFQFASSNFYTCFLAALYAEKYQELVFNDVVREPVQMTTSLKLKARTSISRISRLTHLTKADILKYNLDLKDALKKRAAILPKGFVLHLPPKTSRVQLLGTYKANILPQMSI